MHIRPAQPADAPAIWRIIEPTIRAGETYTLVRNMTEIDALAYWLAEDKETFVAEQDGEILGTYYMRPNQAGGGRHICNCGYFPSPAASAAPSLAPCASPPSTTRASAATPACSSTSSSPPTPRGIALWQSFGFDIVGRLPRAFHHPTLGYVDALVMFRSL